MSRADVLAHIAGDFKRSAVDGVPGAFVREITVDVWDRVVQPALEKGGTAAGIALVIASACDESGAMLFDADDHEAVRALPVRIVNAIATAASGINASGDDAAGN